jgi:hypothetical protein
MSRVLASVAALLAIVWFWAEPQVLAQDKPTRLTLTKTDIEQLLGTDWYGVYLVGKKAGHFKMVFQRNTDPKSPGFIAMLEGKITILAVGAKQETKLSQTFEFEPEPPYALRQGVFSQTSRESTEQKKLLRTEEGFDFIHSRDGEISRKKLGPLEFTLEDHLTPQIWLRRGPKVGAALRSQDFDFDKLRLDIEGRKLLSTKATQAEGIAVKFHEVEMTSSRLMDPIIERYNDTGRLLSGKLGGVIELRYETEEDAKNIEHSTDLFFLGSVKVDVPLGKASQVTALVVEVAGKEATVIKSGPWQSVTQNDSGTMLCKIGRSYGKQIKVTDKEIEENLAETEHYPTTHPKVQALVKEAVGDARTPREKVDRLVHFVSQYISADYRTRPRNLIQLLSVKKGACTEYALLFATLARAAGIPAREVAGLYYMGDELKGFGPHAWNEVVLDGHWLPVDAAWNETEIDATHISFGPSRPDDYNWMAKFLATFGKLSIKLVEVRHKK